MPISLLRRFPRMAKASGTRAASLVDKGRSCGSLMLARLRYDSPCKARKQKVSNSDHLQ